MAAMRKGYAMLVTAGDAEISAALADGIRRGRRAQQAAPLRDERKALTAEQIKVVRAEIDVQKAADLLRVAMHREPVDYAGKCFDAEMQYGESLYERGFLGKIGEKLLVGYALIVLAFERLFERVESGE